MMGKFSGFENSADGLSLSNYYIVRADAAAKVVDW
jgi:hypothetical protein